MPWESEIHRCLTPKQQEIINRKENAGSAWRCPDCGFLWTLEIQNQIGAWVKSDGTRRNIGYLP